MATNAVVRSRIDADVRDRAAEVLGGMGLTVSDAIRIVLTRVANENELPFDLKPNKLTRQTMRKTAKGREVHRAKNAADLYRKLGISWESDAGGQLLNPVSTRYKTAPETRQGSR